MTDTTTPARALLEAATPLPWSVYNGGPSAAYPGIEAPGVTKSVVIWGSADEDAGVQHAPDAALIVTAVNAYPALLDVAEALERLVETAQDVTPTAGLPEPGAGDWARFSESWHAARAALSKLRESE